MTGAGKTMYHGPNSPNNYTGNFEGGMKRLTLTEWEQKYIVRAIERFDQKYTMFKRPSWDSQINDSLKDWSFIGEVKQKPGYTMEDQALRWASRRGTQIDLFNTSKPNPSRVSKAIAVAIASPKQDIQALRYKPPEGAKIDVSDGQRITRDIKKVATYFGADLVGVCKLDRRWVYSHTYEVEGPSGPGGSEAAMGESKPQEIPEEFQYAVVMGFEEDYAMIKYFPTYVADAATSMGYSRMAITNAHLSAFIRNLGFKAIDCSTNDVALSIPMAMQAGLGDLGRHGLLITPQFGPRVRLSKVITDLPLVADAPIEFGLTEFCTTCKKCVEMCPSQSIMPGERTAERVNVSNVAGELKWPINAETCRMYWARGNKPCTICIACCPYNKPSTWFHRLVFWATDHFRWADSFCVKMDDLLGYGKPKQADKFWEEWQPKRGKFT